MKIIKNLPLVTWALMMMTTMVIDEGNEIECL
jgi:hypothetical protein